MGLVGLFVFPSTNSVVYYYSILWTLFIGNSQYGNLRRDPGYAVIFEELINYFGLVCFIFTGETGSLREKAGQYGSPGHAVLFHLSFTNVKIRVSRFTRFGGIPTSNLKSIRI